MQQLITGFHQDNNNDWVTELVCGHFQHVRHNPPLESRPWVLTKDGRDSRLGLPLNCKKCDDGAPPDTTEIDPNFVEDVEQFIETYKTALQNLANR